MGDPRIQGVAGFRLVTQDLERLTRFYRGVLGFAASGPVTPIDRAEMRVLGLDGSGRRQVLRIGREIMAIDEFEEAGRPYPGQGDAASLWFQHLALVVTDIATAHAALRDVEPISEGGPQHLPPEAGGVRAFKFRDPDGHPLEMLCFPPRATPEACRGRSPLPGQIAVGIDHSAISVSDVAASTRFYADLGLTPGKGTLNRGREQQHLDCLLDVEVAVQPLMPDAGMPHLELLGYQVPRGRGGEALRPNDVAATRVVWRGSSASPVLLRDPDGHLHQIEATSGTAPCLQPAGAEQGESA